jgi:hypothetical protein
MRRLAPAKPAHAEENLSDRPLETILVELKPGAPKSPPNRARRRET